MNPTRLGIILVIIGAILIISTISVFGFFFYTQKVSINVNDWGAFGSYLGGVLGTSISILALIGGVIAIYQQHRTEQRVNNQTIASDLMKSIERLEDSIDSSLKELPVAVHYPDHKVRLDTNAFRILTGIYPPEIIANFIPKNSDDPNVIINTIIGANETLANQESFEKMHLYEIFSTTCGKLRLMRSLLSKHKELAGHNVAAIYYEKKYKVAVSRLLQAGYPLETWEDITS